VVDEQKIGAVVECSGHAGELGVHHPDDFVEGGAAFDLQSLGAVVLDVSDLQEGVEVVDQF
jgi:hypothetical protein